MVGEVASRSHCPTFRSELEAFNCGGRESFTLRVCSADVGARLHFFGFHTRFNPQDSGNSKRSSWIVHCEKHTALRKKELVSPVI